MKYTLKRPETKSPLAKYRMNVFVDGVAVGNYFRVSSNKVVGSTYVLNLFGKKYDFKNTSVKSVHDFLKSYPVAFTCPHQLNKSTQKR